MLVIIPGFQISTSLLFSSTLKLILLDSVETLDILTSFSELFLITRPRLWEKKITMIWLTIWFQIKLINRIIQKQMSIFHSNFHLFLGSQDTVNDSCGILFYYCSILVTTTFVLYNAADRIWRYVQLLHKSVFPFSIFYMILIQHQPFHVRIFPKKIEYNWIFIEFGSCFCKMYFKKPLNFIALSRLSGLKSGSKMA